MNATFFRTMTRPAAHENFCRRALLPLSLAAILAALFLSDEATHRFATQHQSARLDLFFAFILPFGHAVFPLAVAAFLFLGGALRRDARWKRAALGILWSAVLSSLLVLVGKPLFARHENLHAHRRAHAAKHKREKVTREYSQGAARWLQARWGRFPSGDSALAFSTAAPVALELPPVVGWPMLCLATCVAFERVYRNAHFASDVFAGAALACFVAQYVMARLRRASTRRQLPTS